MRFKLLLTVCLALGFLPVFAKSHDKAKTKEAKESIALKNAVVLIIRHAEKPASGEGLSPLGEQRARRYINYFKDFSIDSKPLKLEHIFAAANSKESHRPVQTVEPLSRALGLAVDARFKNKDFLTLASEIKTHFHGRNILVCWHHGEILDLLRALGADPATVLPKSKWPDSVFGWVIQLQYDKTGQLIQAKRINEQLFPDDLPAEK